MTLKKWGVVILVVMLGLSGVVFFLPYKYTIKQTLQTPAYLNLPCERALVQNSPNNKNTIKLDVTATGVGWLSFKKEAQQIKLLKNGVFANLSCTINVRLMQQNSIFIPKPMPFVARGVVPQGSEHALSSSTFMWRRIEGLR